MKKLGFFALSLTLAAILVSAAPKKPGDPAKGKAVFEQCAVCHNPDNNDKKVGPGLKGLFKKVKLNSGKKVTDDTVLARINQGGDGMPAYAEMLNDQEKTDLLAYLKTL